MWSGGRERQPDTGYQPEQERLYDALRAAKVATQTHPFEEGGHGFGLRFTEGKPVAVWPELVLAWWKWKRSV